jgi:hypothetical protein
MEQLLEVVVRAAIVILTCISDHFIARTLSQLGDTGPYRT